MNTPYAYEVTTTYLVRSGSVTHDNAAMFKPLYEGE